jgi:iron complex transport system substrate-binding protein
MRIASLVPSATETLFAMGLGDYVVGVTHECDYPPAARQLPHLTRSIIPEGLMPAEIDRAVRERTQRGQAIYELDTVELADAAPSLIVTQALCAVCAVSVDDVRVIADQLASQPQVVSLDPTSLGEMLTDIRTLGTITDQVDEAEALVAELADRLDRVRDLVAGLPPVPVVTLEWLDPVYLGGHWVPQMVGIAGGFDMLGMTGERSRVSSWDEVRSAMPAAVVCMPCGYDLQDSIEQATKHPAVFELGVPVYAVDAAGHFSRPGPRLVDGVEQLAQILHPERFPDAEPAWVRVEPVAA